MSEIVITGVNACLLGETTEDTLLEDTIKGVIELVKENPGIFDEEGNMFSYIEGGKNLLMSMNRVLFSAINYDFFDSLELVAGEKRVLAHMVFSKIVSSLIGDNICEVIHGQSVSTKTIKEFFSSKNENFDLEKVNELNPDEEGIFYEDVIMFFHEKRDWIKMAVVKFIKSSDGKNVCFSSNVEFLHNAVNVDSINKKFQEEHFLKNKNEIALFSDENGYYKVNDSLRGLIGTLCRGQMGTFVLNNDYTKAQQMAAESFLLFSQMFKSNEKKNEEDEE